MKRAPLSVIIPTFNSGELLIQAVDSALAQTVEPAEVIVIDDGSRDDTRERLGCYGGRIRYMFQENRGVAAARNLGLDQAGGEWVAFLDADDVWHPRKLELQLRAMTRRPELGLLGTGICNWPAAAFPAVEPRAAERVNVVPWRRLVVKNHFVTSSVLLRRGALEKAGRFDTALHGPEDYDLWLRVAEVAAVANLDAPLTGYRAVPGSLSRRPDAMDAGMRRILRKLDERAAWSGSTLLRRKAHGYCDYSCAYMYAAAGRPGRAIRNLLRSLLWYPLPYARPDVQVPLARLRLLRRACSRYVAAAAGVRAAGAA